MTTAMIGALVLALACALAAVALGRNLVRSIIAGFAFLGLLGFALLVAGGGYLAMIVVIMGALVLGTIQLFGWMLVDVDRDHLPPTDRPTAVARGIAFVLVGAGIALLMTAALTQGEFVPTGEGLPIVTPAEVGAHLFGALREATVLVGLLIAASLLAVLLLLHDEKERR
jgi:hypothetical protein